MNWDAIGAISAGISAVAVMASLIYLAFEVRTGAKMLRTTTRDLTFQHLMEWNYTMLQNNLAHVFQLGCKDFDSLDDEDKARFIHVTYSFFKVFEKSYLHYLDGAIGEESWQYNQNILFAYVNEPGIVFYFQNRKGIYDPRFVKLVEDAPAIDMAPALKFMAEAGIRGEKA